jgi:hypothetical protein
MAGRIFEIEVPELQDPHSQVLNYLNDQLNCWRIEPVKEDFSRWQILDRSEKILKPILRTVLRRRNLKRVNDTSIYLIEESFQYYASTTQRKPQKCRKMTP